MTIIHVNSDGTISEADGLLLGKELWKYSGKSVAIHVGLALSGRSNAYNAYYHGVVVQHQIRAIFDLWGVMLSPADMHEINCNTWFCIWTYDAQTGEYKKERGSTTDHDNKSFGERLGHIRQYFYLHFQYEIPLPESQM